MKKIKEKETKKVVKTKKNKKEKVDKEILFKKRFKDILVISISIIIIELIIMYLINLSRNSEVKFADTFNSINKYSDFYIATGSSNFKYSKYNDSFIYEYTDTNEEKEVKRQVYAEQAKLVKYDKELNVLFESTFMGDYDSTFYDAISTKNGIYAVGSYIYEESQISLKTRDGLIVKYNKDGKMEWFKNFQILGDTEFKRIIEVDDGLIVVGQSIYENMEIGTHDQGGGIIIKYDFDGNIIWENNFGGNKSGIFNDVIKVDDGYICVGKDAVNYGLIVKFNLNGERIWVKNYSNTDEIGFSRAILKDDKIYIAGSFNKSNEKDKDGNIKFEYDAAVFIYSLDGELLDLYSIGGSSLDRFNSLILNDNQIIAVGYTKSKDIDVKGLNYNEKTTEGIIVSFDYKGNVIDAYSYSGSKNESLTGITESITETENLINNTKDYIVVGYTNSKRGVFTGNNKDYFSKVIKFDSKLNIIEEK